jgi:GT2 family glycosyltransferase
MSDSAIRLSIVFLNFNRLNETRTTCKQLLNLFGHRNDVEIIAVDNGSSDGTADYLQNQHYIKALLLTDNGGIAGYNRGFEHAQGEYILVLDDDSCPQDEQGINQAVDYLQMHPQTAIIACRIDTPDQQQQWSWHLPATDEQGISPFFVGCGFIIRRDVFASIDWYPGDFFLYQNEADVAFKVYQLGYDIFYLPQCRIIHRGYPSQRPGWRRVFYPTRNTIWMIRRYFPFNQAIYLITSRIIIGLIRAIQFGQLKTYFKALYQSFNKPITKTVLSTEVRQKTRVFWKQNSIIHQLFGIS